MVETGFDNEPASLLYKSLGFKEVKQWDTEIGIRKIRFEKHASKHIIEANSKSDYQTLASLATIVWTEHYVPIIGIKQVEYMLEKFQSAKTIEQQILAGANYYLLQSNNKDIGYLSISKKEESLFLSKLYVLSSVRGQGFGKIAMEFINNRAIALQCDKITLTVNKYNTNAIKAYEKMGFKKIKEVIFDIGEGYIMDDYYMEKLVV